MKICGVTFKDNGKIYNFDPTNLVIQKGDYVIVETEKGEQYGKVITIETKEIASDLKPVLRVATEADDAKYLKNLADAKNTLILARQMASSLGLEMQLIDSNYTFDRKQLLFNFIADARVDFRELVKLLASKFKTRIELHQIGVRDKAKEISGLGQCGRPLCCSSFLNRIETITINMAKNQNIALKPTKINGSCGRLLCCLSYEDDQYIECRKTLPNLGSTINHQGKKGRVVSVDILNQKYKLDVDGEIKEVKINGHKCHK